MRNGRLLFASLGISLALVACEGRHAADVLQTLPPGEIEPTVVHYSAPVLFALSVSTGSGSSFSDGCPSETVEGSSRILQGGCTDGAGREWFGRAVVPAEMTAGATGTIRYEGFGSDEPTDCEDEPAARVRLVIDGTVTLSGGASGTEFDSDLVITRTGVLDDCTDGEILYAIDYAGSMTQSGETRQTWSGSGTVGSELAGRYDVRTDDEVLDSSVCSYEPLSGSTTVTAGEHVAIVTYDGATDCDEDSTATWTLDGADQGELTGVQCSASPGRSGGAVIALFALGAAMALRVRRCVRREV